MKLLVDLSYYNNLNSSQWDLLADVIDGVIIRLSFGLSQDTMAQTHINNAKKFSLPFAGYHWVDPTLDLNAQVKFVQSQVEKFSPASLFNDYEQYWSDWAAYMRQDLASAYATRFSPSQLNGYYFRFHQSMKSLVKVPVGSYSAEWFITKYSPDLGSWIYDENYWEARYLRYYDSAWWLSKQKELGKNFNINKMIEIAQYAKIVKGIARQFESYAEVGGLDANIGYHLDWDVFSDDSYYKLFGVERPKTEEPIPEVKPVFVAVSQQVGTQALRLRAEPSTNADVLAGELAGVKLKVVETPELALTKIGVIGQWLKVLDPQARLGYVAAWFVELVPPDPTLPEQPQEPPKVESLYVAVAADIGTMGLRLRSQPNTNSATLAGLSGGSVLQVLEPIETALPKVGVVDQWLNVEDPQGVKGYVAAWYVVKAEAPQPVTEVPVVPPGQGVDPGLLEQKYKVTASALWVRDKPDGTKIGYLYKDDVITVSEVADKWARFEKGWVYMTYIMPV